MTSGGGGVSISPACRSIGIVARTTTAAIVSARPMLVRTAKTLTTRTASPSAPVTLVRCHM